MNSKEIIKRTLEFDHPKRVGHSFAPGDIISAGATVKTHATDWKDGGSGKWEHKDQWGNLWSRIDATSCGEVERGVLENIEDIESYEFPDYSNPKDFPSVSSDKWINGSLPGFAFNVARKMRKLDQYLMDIILERDKIRLLHDKIDAMLEHMIENYAAAGADGVMFAEDWGTEEQTLISPAMWHEEFFPRFKKLCSLAHSHSLKVFMHSCGKIEKIIPGLIEAGIDCLQFDQPTLHGIDKLASYQENAKITFWCPVDIQKTLQAKNEKSIRGEAREMIDKLWKGRGGFIGGFYGDNASIGLEPKWQEIASDEYLKQGIAGNYITCAV